MDNLLGSAPIQRQLFKNVSETERRGNSCVISFCQRRRRGRYWVAIAIIIATVVLLSLGSQAGAGAL